MLFAEVRAENLNQHLTTDAKPSSQKHYRNSKRYIITAQRWSSKRQTGDSVSSSTQPFGGDDRAKSDYLDQIIELNNQNKDLLEKSAHLQNGQLKIEKTNLNINFLRRPKPGELTAVGKNLKLGQRLAIGEVSLLTGGKDGELVAHVTGTYSVPPRS